jgi:uncharacterized membrane protein
MVDSAPPALSMTEPSPNRGVMIILAYLWVLAFIPLLLERDDAEVQWHAKHGVILMAAELILLVVFVILTGVVTVAWLGVGALVTLALILGWVGVLGLHLIAMIKGINGVRLHVPGVSVYADRL